jgi:hypothetical protein
LFFSGAGLARLSNCPPAAPLKNKKKGGGSRFGYKQVTPSGVFGPLRTLAVLRRREIQAVCINQFLSNGPDPDSLWHGTCYEAPHEYN